MDKARSPSMQVIAVGILGFSYGNNFLPFVYAENTKNVWYFEPENDAKNDWNNSS